MKPAEYSCEVKSFRMLTPTVYELAFDTDRPMEFKAGQFISVVIPGAGPKGRDLRRAYSIASAPEVRPIELCIKLVDEGPGSQYLHKLRPGDIFRGVAPYGDFVYKPKSGFQVCFIATGTGIAPFHSMLRSNHFAENPPTQAHCFFGVRTANELLYLDVFRNLSHLRFVPTVSQAEEHWTGFRGRVTDFLKGLNGDFDWLHTEYYLCGHGGMIAEVKAFLMEKGVTKDAMHQEIYYK